MDILDITYQSEGAMLEKIRQTPLKGQPSKNPYLHSFISVETLDPTELHPAQNYVLKSELEKIKDLYFRLWDNWAHNILRLCYEVQVHYADGTSVGIIPPVVEEVILNGKVYRVVADGVHRTYFAYLMHSPINVIYVRGVNRFMPYYSMPLHSGWDTVNLIEEIPEGFWKKTYVSNNHKMLFRDYTVNFNNLSVGRGYAQK